MSAFYADRFATLCRSIREGEACLPECRNLQSGAEMTAVCISHEFPDGRIQCVPIARMFERALGSLVLPAQSDRPLNCSKR